VKNVLSIDLESWFYFHDEGLGRRREPASTASGRERDDGYLPLAVETLLDLLGSTGRKATFFVLAEIWEWYPELVDEIQGRGHEVGYHGHGHRLLADRSVLAEELERSRSFLEQVRPTGFRAPWLHLTEDCYPLLAAHGFTYSSSSYGSGDTERIGGSDEIPVSALAYRRHATPEPLPRHLSLGRLMRMLPFGGALFLALLGRGTGRLIQRRNREDRPAVLFLHPWQIQRRREIEGLAFKAAVAVRNPLCLPYTRDVSQTLRWLLERFELTSFQECFYG
jgi:peptidoglycan/xylan/chitin deacetylase (PgdA/CDA1 family)